MITKYKGHDGEYHIIAKMDDSHLLNAERYFAKKRLAMQSNSKTTGKDLLEISLLINALWQEIDKRELLKY